MSEIKVMNNDEIRDFCIKKDLKIFELEQELQQKENIIKEVRKYIEEKEKDDDNWVDYELLIEPIRIKEIFQHQFFNDNSNKRLDDLYDLIKADVVEKVEE